MPLTTPKRSPIRIHEKNLVMYVPLGIYYVCWTFYPVYVISRSKVFSYLMKMKIYSKRFSIDQIIRPRIACDFNYFRDYYILYF